MQEWLVVIMLVDFYMYGWHEHPHHTHTFQSLTSNSAYALLEIMHEGVIHMCNILVYRRTSAEYISSMTKSNGVLSGIVPAACRLRPCYSDWKAQTFSCSKGTSCECV